MYFLPLCLIFCVISLHVKAYTIGLKPGNKECFVLNLESDQPCSGSYEVITKSPDPILVTVRAPDGSFQYRNDPQGENGLKDEKGESSPDDEVDSGEAFEFDAILEGDYTMCMQYDKEMADDGEERIMAFNFRASSKAPGFSKEYTGLESELDALQRGLDTLKDHHAYMSQREDVHKTALDAINFKVLCWTVLEGAILIVTAVWQISYIGSFFETKRRL